MELITRHLPGFHFAEQDEGLLPLADAQAFAALDPAGMAKRVLNFMALPKATARGAGSLSTGC